MGEFEDYTDEVTRYGFTWFRTDSEARAASARLPRLRAKADQLALNGGLVGTHVFYRIGDRWMPRRRPTHREVVAEAMRRGGAPATPAGTPTMAPHAVLLLGLPGSGKSSKLQPVATELLRQTLQEERAVVDADVVRELLPEYAGGLGSEVVQVETSYLANGPLLDEAYDRRASLVLDKVGDPETTVAAAEFLLANQWSVWCLCSQIDAKLAVERVRQRAVKTGRYVPLDYVRNLGDRPIRAYEALRDSRLDISGCALLATDVGPDDPPIVIDDYPGGSFGEPGAPVRFWPAPEGRVA